MLITYPSPILLPSSGITYTGPQVTGLSGMRDGRSGGLTILAWGTGTEEEILASNEAQPVIEPRVAALVNLEGLPAGLDVEVALKEVGGGYTYQPRSVKTHRTRSGETAVLAYWPAGLSEVEGVRFTIQSGGAVAAEHEFAVGEVVLAGAADFGLDPGWELGTIDPAGGTVSKNGQLYLQPVPAGRSLSVSIPPHLFTDAMLKAGAVQDLRESLANDPRCIVVTDWSSQAAAEASWLYGTASRIDGLRFESRSRRATIRLRVNEMVGRAI